MKKTRKARILALISAQDITIRDVVTKLDCTAQQAWASLAYLHTGGQIHITGWVTPAHGRTIPLYTNGPGDDVVRPATVSGAEACAQWRARKNWGITASAIDRQLQARKAKVTEAFDADKAFITRSIRILTQRLAQLEQERDRTVAFLEESARHATHIRTRARAPAPSAAPLPSALSLLGQLQGLAQ